jgi:hypothetical protein
MNKKVKQTVYAILLEDEYARENDNYLIMRVAQKLDEEASLKNFQS